jgi:hypothetical protein
MSKIYLPLKLWTLVAVMVSMSAILLSHDWKVGESQEQKSEILNLSRLRQKTRKYHIVALGNSLLACGMPFDRVIEAKLERAEINTIVSRITISGMDSEYFISNFSKILDSKPNLLILQAELFMFDFNDRQQLQLGKTFQKNIDNFREMITANLIGADANGNYGDNRSDHNRSIFKVECKNKFIDRSKFNTNARKAYKNIQIGTNNHLSSYLPVIQQAQQLGIKVVLLEMGRSKAANDYFGKDTQTAINESLATIAARTNAQVWRFPANLPLDYYCDLAHLNYRGEQVFTEWFTEQLKTKL